MSHWAPAMSRWTSNATWLHLKSAKTTQKGAKRARHVALGPHHVALDLQRDVAPAQRVQNCLKEGEKSAPRRIGPPPCRVGLPTLRGSSPKSPKQPKREQKERVTSYWPPPCRVGAPTRRGSSPKAAKQPKRDQEERATSHCAPAMSCWTSNATWLHLKSAKTTQKGAKRARHVALGPHHVALDLQRDVAPAQRVQNCLKEGEKSAPRRIGPPPCRVGLPTRRGSPTLDSIVL